MEGKLIKSQDEVLHSNSKYKRKPWPYSVAVSSAREILFFVKRKSDQASLLRFGLDLG